MNMKLRPLAIVIAAALVPIPATAADSAAGAAALDMIYVIARKIPQAQAEVVNAVGQVDREALDRIQAQTIRDAFRYEPAVSVAGDSHRFGLVTPGASGCADEIAAATERSVTLERNETSERSELSADAGNDAREPDVGAAASSRRPSSRACAVAPGLPGCN